MNTSSNVTAGKPNIGGAIWQGDATATLPTDALAALGSGFKCLGYISDDGLTASNSPNATPVKAWGGDTVLTILGDKSDQFSFKLIEVLNLDVLKTVFGEENVTGDLENGITVKANASDLDEHSYVIDMVMRDNVIKRICIPSAKVTSIGDVVYSDGEAVGYDVTIDCYPDGAGNTHYEYLQKKKS